MLLATIALTILIMAAMAAATALMLHCAEAAVDALAERTTTHDIKH